MDGVLAEIRRLGRTLRWSAQGWRAAWATQKSLRQWTWVNLVSASLALALDLDGGERALILALGLLVLAAELLNSAIEATVDLVSPDPHPKAGMAKDCASAAVAVTGLAGAVAWLVILWG